MSTRRVLLVSSVRPSRASRLAKRITRDIGNVEICGLLQRPMQKLSFDQQMIASRTVDSSLYKNSGWNLKQWFYSAMERLLQSAVWFIHGCPKEMSSTALAEKDLKESCREIGSPFFLGKSLNTPSVLRFITDQQPDLVILIGDDSPSPELLQIPREGWIRARQSVVQDATTNTASEVAITIESLVSDTDSHFNIAQMILPREPYESQLGRTLKADLIADDLIVQTAREILKGHGQEAAEAVTQWKDSIFSSCAEQRKLAEAQETQILLEPVRYRSTWNLFLDTLLLCSPFVVARNWYRRLNGKYPVTILTCHLVSDRAHRMAISTETFFRQVTFLRKHYRIVSLCEAVELLRSGHVTSPTVVLTFDDGYADNFVSLRAVAEECGIPIALFIATQPVDLQEEFGHDLGFGIRGFLPLTWKQIRYWGRGNIEFGAHTRTHFDCGSDDATKLEEEIVGSGLDLERHLEKPVDLFAFPFGQRENISPQAFQLAKACYRHVFSGFGGENCPGDQNDHHHLLRKNFYANAWELELDLQSIFSIIDRVKQKLPKKRPTITLDPHPVISGSELTSLTSKTQLNAS